MVIACIVSVYSWLVGWLVGRLSEDSAGTSEFSG